MVRLNRTLGESGVSCRDRARMAPVSLPLAADQFLESGLVADWIEVRIVFREGSEALRRVDRARAVGRLGVLGSLVERSELRRPECVVLVFDRGGHTDPRMPS